MIKHCQLLHSRSKDVVGGMSLRRWHVEPFFRKFCSLLLMMKEAYLRNIVWKVQVSMLLRRTVWAVWFLSWCEGRKWQRETEREKPRENEMRRGASAERLTGKRADPGLRDSVLNTRAPYKVLCWLLDVEARLKKHHTEHEWHGSWSMFPHLNRSVLQVLVFGLWRLPLMPYKLFPRSWLTHQSRLPFLPFFLWLTLPFEWK